MDERDLQEQHKRHSIQTEVVLFSGLLALPVVAIVQLLSSTEPLDWPLFVSVLCFAVSIPLLATRVFERRRHLAAEHLVKAQELGSLKVLSDFAGYINVVGLAAVFFHFSYIVGGVFIASGVVSLLALLTLRRDRKSQ